MLYGYSPGTQWAALSFYETVSSGIICEDYERQPPSERRRFPNQFSAASNVPTRPLTKDEMFLARQYHGGNCWIKVTFDSAEAAERAMYHSPHLLQGHWVYAEPFHGAGPEVDESIPMQDGDRGQGRLGVPSRASQILGSIFHPKNKVHSRGANPLNPSATASRVDCHSNQRLGATTRNENINDGQAATLEPSSSVRDPRFFTHFPTVPRTILRPAHEAFLPHSSRQNWFEAMIARLTAAGWLPGDIIGDSIPVLETGEFDWTGANLYWKLFYWIDSHLGSDFCGRKDE